MRAAQPREIVLLAFWRGVKSGAKQVKSSNLSFCDSTWVTSIFVPRFFRDFAISHGRVVEKGCESGHRRGRGKDRESSRNAVGGAVAWPPRGTEKNVQQKLIKFRLIGGIQ